MLTTIDPRQHPNLKLHSLLLVFDADPNRYREDLAFPVETNSGIPLLSFPTQIKLNQGFFRQNNISAYFDREFMSPISVDEVLGCEYKEDIYKKFSDFTPPFFAILFKYSCVVPSLFVQPSYNLNELECERLLPQLDIKDRSFRIKTGLIEMWGHPPRTQEILFKTRDRSLKKLTKPFREKLHQLKMEIKKILTLQKKLADKEVETNKKIKNKLSQAIILKKEI